MKRTKAFLPALKKKKLDFSEPEPNINQMVCTNVTLQFGSIPLIPKSKKKPEAKTEEIHITNEGANEGDHEGEPPNPDAEVTFLAIHMKQFTFQHFIRSSGNIGKLIHTTHTS